MTPLAHRRRRLRRRTQTLSKCSLAVLVAVTTASSSSGAHAALCSQSDISSTTTLVNANKAAFQACRGDLKLPAASAADAWTSFISEEYLQDANADTLCASENCVKALIVAMEKFPDCCSSSGSKVQNIPRLADDILHQCDVRDARQLAAELEAEIAKLPDLKVQIMSLGVADAGSFSGDGNSTVGEDGVDVIIDVKKRELMKQGVGISSNGTESQSIGDANAARVGAVAHAAAVGAAVLASAVLLL